ncbi:MAG: 1-acyl-sn-glycerol-3-phosphate acyltransferase [Deltaproteobacteria bacterium]|nr:1-acyl-sn-glycerol-3-phosphate acyltransferase [Deltaproteobacteria bacterium]
MSNDPASWGLTGRTSEAAPPASRLYRGLRRVVRAALRVFYRTVEVTGRENLGARGHEHPTILASTHPNSIVDPLLLGILEQRQVTFCARDGLFKIPLFGRLLKAVGAVPIARPEDKGKDSAVPGDAPAPKVDNSAAFAAARAVLQQRGVISIFPEGKTHDNLRVHRLRTGAARIALDAEDKSDWQLGVGIVPVALNYLVRQAFRSDVHVAFGPPIPVADLRPLYTTDPKAAARELTDRIERSLRDLAVHVEAAEDERIIAQITSIIVDIRREQGLDQAGQTPSERTALVRRIVDAYRWYQQIEPEKTAELRRRLQRFLEERQELGLGGDSAALQHRSEARSTFDERRRFLLRGAPFALWGLVNSVVPYLLLRLVLALTPLRKDRMALAKLLVGAGLFLGAWGVQTGLVAGSLTGLLGAPWGALAAIGYALSLPPTALVALRWVTEARLHRLSRGGLKALLRHGDRIEALKKEREALKAELAALRDRYLARVQAT